MAGFRARRHFSYAKKFYKPEVTGSAEVTGVRPRVSGTSLKVESERNLDTYGVRPPGLPEGHASRGLLEKRAEVLRWFGGEGLAGELLKRAVKVFREVQFPRVEEL